MWAISVSLSIHVYVCVCVCVQRPPLHIGVVAIEKGAFGLPSTMVANLLYIYCWNAIKEVVSDVAPASLQILGSTTSYLHHR